MAERMLPMRTAVSQALCRSIAVSAPLIGDLPEAPVFLRRELRITTDDLPPLDFGQKLGHLCEDALAALLGASPRFDLLARNLKVRRDPQTTVGELDFLLRDLGSEQLVHLELATKFYLAVDTETGIALPGPDARDNYFKKLHRLRTHQLQLPALHQCHLPEPYRHEPIVSQQLVHGCLFDHIDRHEPATAEFVNPRCRRGRWLPIDEVADRFPPEVALEVVPKPLWPVPIEHLGGIPLQRWSPRRRIDRCVMLRVSGETLPYFVTPADYPGPG